MPGLNGSGPDHWQSWFEREIPGAVRVIQRDWKDANVVHWSARVVRDLNRVPGQVFVVAHSFGCLAAVRALDNWGSRVSGLMLVAPADPQKFGPSCIVPESPLGVPAVLVASTNDPWMRFARAVELAKAWGAQLVNLGAVGHINQASGFGAWPQGLAMLEGLRREANTWSERRPAEDNSIELGRI